MFLLEVFFWVETRRICFMFVGQVAVSKIARVMCGAGSAAGRSVLAALGGGGGGGGSMRRAPCLPAGGSSPWRSGPS